MPPSAAPLSPASTVLAEPSTRRAARWLAACVLLVLGSALFASLIQNSWGRVQVVGLNLPTQNGQWLAADLFRPRSATVEHKAPLVVVVPGFQRSKETMTNVALELARRGVVAIAIDPYAQGSSSASMSPQSATLEGYGLFAVVELAANTELLNYVDKSRLGATGHSAGGNAVMQAAAYFGREAERAGRPSKLHSAFISGYVLSLTDKLLDRARSNLGISYALYDEGAYRNELGHGDMRRAPEALRLVNSSAALATTPVAEVELDHFYGNAAVRNLRVVHNERTLHPLQPYSVAAMANQLEFFERVFDLKSGLSSRDQVWFWKELLTLVALVAALVALVPAAQLLLAHVRFFQPLAHPLPPPQPRAQGAGRLMFWTLLVAGAVVACFSYIPLAELSQRWFAAAAGREQTWFFPQRMNNAVMLWALLNGAVGFLLFYLGYRTHGRRHGVTPAMWGATTSLGELARTAVLALTLFAGFYGLLFVVSAVFHVDYRFLFLGVRVFQPALLIFLAMYAPAFLPFFLANSLRVNGAMRPAGLPEWRSKLLGGLANSLGLLLIIIVQYATFACTGTVHWTDGWLYINLLFAVVPMMFVLPYFNRAFFNLTGRIYLGPLTTCLVFIMIMISNTVCYIPL